MDDSVNYYWCYRCEELRIDGACRCESEVEIQLHELLFPLVV